MEKTNGHILVVDDNEIASSAATKVFAKNGYYVDVAVDGKKAMELLKLKNYDAVITDLAMPYVTGQQLIRAIRHKFFNSVRIMVVSSIADEAVIAEALEAGANDYMTKPFNATELFLRAQKMLNKPI